MNDKKVSILDDRNFLSFFDVRKSPKCLINLTVSELQLITATYVWEYISEK